MNKGASKIIPHLWFDKNAHEAARFYTSIFPNSKIKSTTIQNSPYSGDFDIVSFELWGQEFMAIGAGPYFKFNPSISFVVNFAPSRLKNASEMLDQVWSQLADGGTVLMPLGKYPYSKKYGWIQDKYGLSWQLILTNPEGEERPEILPSLLFVNENAGKAEEAMNFYFTVFKNSKTGQIVRYPKGMEPDQEGTIMFADFLLEDQWFVVMDSARNHEFNFNEAISFLVNCDSQDEIDGYWEKLSAVPEAEQSGWLKDKYGISWQIVPKELDEMMTKGSPEQIARMNSVMLKMKKLDLVQLRKAYEGDGYEE